MKRIIIIVDKYNPFCNGIPICIEKSEGKNSRWQIFSWDNPFGTTVFT